MPNQVQRAEFSTRSASRTKKPSRNMTPIGGSSHLRQVVAKSSLVKTPIGGTSRRRRGCDQREIRRLLGRAVPQTCWGNLSGVKGEWRSIGLLNSGVDRRCVIYLRRCRLATSRNRSAPKGISAPETESRTMRSCGPSEDARGDIGTRSVSRSFAANASISTSARHQHHLAQCELRSVRIALAERSIGRMRLDAGPHH